MKRVKNKKPRAPEKDYATRMVLAALACAEKSPWESITLDHIARSAKVSFSDAKRLFPDINDLLPAIVRYVDHKVERTLGVLDPQAQEQERLFAVIMARFDVLQNHRKGFIAIMDTCMNHPSMFLALFSPLMTSMQHMLRIARLDENRASSPIKIMALLVLYQAVILRWKSDKSSDMSATMATLNSSLLRFVKCLSQSP